MANLLIFFGAVAVIGLVAMCVCKKKKERQPTVNHRFPLVDETANSTGSSAEHLDEPDARPESLRFIERTEAEKREDETEDDVMSADPNDTVQAHEANRLNFREDDA